MSTKVVPVPVIHVAFRAWLVWALGCIAVWFLVACGGDSASTSDPADPNSAGAEPSTTQTSASLALGTVTNVQMLPSCPAGVPAGSQCVQVTVAGCPGIETE